MNKLPCEECTRTNNHCCKADIPLEVPVALSLIGIGKEKGFNNLSMHSHPKFENRVFIFDKSWIDGNEVDLTMKDCVFFRDGKCAIYEDRPDICRLYGTKWIRCRWEAGGILSYSKISRANMEDIRFYDEEANMKSGIKKVLKDL